MVKRLQKLMITSQLLLQFMLGRLPWWDASRYYTRYMSTGQTLQIESSSLKDTLALAEKIGSRLRGGEVVELISDLGGGKTAFVKGLAKGMGSPDTVSSPSFTLNNVYGAGELELHHFDFYRLSEPGIMRDELAEAISMPNTVVAVEWANIVEDVLPADRLTVAINATGAEARRITLTCSAELEYLLG